MNKARPTMSNRTLSATGRKLTLVVLGLAALITTMLCAFALPSLQRGARTGLRC
ncbi:hypothetical protein AB0O51_19055 [Streptomyces sp. NPDC090301]|uniref:hypothetical protein n=1 Tax=Streptomyces sp. NPDC090301 TaxID=3154975 RepID=UPI0034356443